MLAQVRTDPVPVFAVDGPTAAGKTTTSRILASTLDLAYLESGRAYRQIALTALERGVYLKDHTAITALCDDILSGNGQMFLTLTRGDESTALRAPEVSRAVSYVARVPALRRRITDLIRFWAAASGPSIIEGRDIGTVVFPDAKGKFFLTATADVRAQRRAKDEKRSYTEVFEDLMRRDETDASREVAPLVAASDAVVIDTTSLPIEIVVSKMLSVCRSVSFQAR